MVDVSLRAITTEKNTITLSHTQGNIQLKLEVLVDEERHLQWLSQALQSIQYKCFVAIFSVYRFRKRTIPEVIANDSLMPSNLWSF